MPLYMSTVKCPLARIRSGRLRSGEFWESTILGKRIDRSILILLSTSARNGTRCASVHDRGRFVHKNRRPARNANFLYTSPVRSGVSDTPFWCCLFPPLPVEDKEFPPRMTQQTDLPQFNNETIAFLLTFLRNATAPVTTAELVEALKKQASR
jgi:hypothetical protein